MSPSGWRTSATRGTFSTAAVSGYSCGTRGCHQRCPSTLTCAAVRLGTREAGDAFGGGGRGGGAAAMASTGGRGEWRWRHVCWLCGAVAGGAPEQRVVLRPVVSVGGGVYVVGACVGGTGMVCVWGEWVC